MRQTVVIPKDHLKDPRSRPFPELHESSFKSMIAVPIVAPGEEILGKCLDAPTEDAFTSPDVNLASEVGSLLASGLIQAETVNQLRIQSAAARFLRDLPDEAWGSLRQCLHSMARQCALHLEADVCMIELATDRAHPHGATTAIVTTQRSVTSTAREYRMRTWTGAVWHSCSSPSACGGFASRWPPRHRSAP